MRKFLEITVLVLLWSNISFADDISEFEIEGMSIGDSLLSYFSEEEIIKNIDPNNFKDTDGKFKTSGFYELFEDYDGIQFSFMAKDKKYIIHGISAGNFYSDFKECQKKLKSISKELSVLFSDSEIYLDIKQKHPADKSGGSTAIADIFILKTGSVSARCTDWSDEITASYGWSDNLRVGIKSKEYNEWLP